MFCLLFLLNFTPDFIVQCLLPLLNFFPRYKCRKEKSYCMSWFNIKLLDRHLLIFAIYIANNKINSNYFPEGVMANLWKTFNMKRSDCINTTPFSIQSHTTYASSFVRRYLCSIIRLLFACLTIREALERRTLAIYWYRSFGVLMLRSLS